MIAALIHPDGRLTTLRGELATDPVSIAALGHAVHAAGNELAVRAGAGPVQNVTLHGLETCLTLLPTPQGVLLLEHEKNASADTLRTLADDLLAQTVAPAPAAPVTASISLADALHASAP